MNFMKYLPLIILLFFLLKFLISYIEKATLSLEQKMVEKQIEFGIISIKDIQKNNYKTFIKIINLYFNILGFKDTVEVTNEYDNLTNFKTILNKENVFISCIQNDLIENKSSDNETWELINLADVQNFLARMVINDCKKGMIITNSSFSKDALKFINDFNNKNQEKEIKLINGYELTKTIRNHKSYIMKEGLMNEVKYNI